MWKRSFVATTVALGDGVDVALAALGDDELDAAAAALARDLRAADRATRAAALARSVRDVVVAIDEGALR